MGTSSWVPKVIQGLYGVCFSTLAVFLVPYYKTRGIQTDRIGVLLAATLLTQTLTVPVLTSIADVSRRHLVAAVVCAGVGSAFVLCVPVAASLGFWAILGSVVLWSAFHPAVSPLVDTVCIGLVGEKRYGSARLWCSIGWGVCSVGVGYLSLVTGPSTFFYVHAATLALLVASFVTGAVLVSRMGRQGEAKSVGEGSDAAEPMATPAAVGVPQESEVAEPAQGDGGREPARRRGFVREVFGLLTKWEMLVLIVRVFVTGMCQAQINYVFPALADRFGSSPYAIVGVGTLCSIAIETPLFGMGSLLVSKFGLEGLMLISHLFLFLRFVLYATVVLGPQSWASPWLWPPVELLHGLFFSPFWLSAVARAEQLAADASKGTSQGLFRAAYCGIGYAVGTWGGGYLYRRRGGVVLFGVTALVMLGLSILSTCNTVVLFFCLRRKSGHSAGPDAKFVALEDVSDKK